MLGPGSKRRACVRARIDSRELVARCRGTMSNGEKREQRSRRYERSKRAVHFYFIDKPSNLFSAGTHRVTVYRYRFVYVHTRLSSRQTSVIVTSKRRERQRSEPFRAYFYRRSVLYTLTDDNVASLTTRDFSCNYVS